MRYISIDIETTGLDFENCQILEIGAIIEDTNKQLAFNQIPKFSCIVKHDLYVGQSYAINMNARIFKILADFVKLRGEHRANYKKKYNILNDYEVADAFYNFLLANGYETQIPKKEKKKPHKPKIKIVVAGKNYSAFDGRFLSDKLPKWNDRFIVSHKVIDPGNFYIDWKNDDEVPGLGECKKRAGIDGEVSHDAIEDAWDVIQLLRKKY